ncbi:MAG: OprD family outer membrane porin [Campylobacterota bacterium]|nr:OprD family outer membrane porin [Campylobacterota bacterium]
MKQSITISLLLISSVFLPASDRLSEAVGEMKYKAQLRYYTLHRSYDELVKNSAGSFDLHHKYQKNSHAVGGYFGFESATLHHLSIGSTLYTSQPIFHNPTDEGGLQLLKDNQDGYSVLGEAFAKWEYENTIVKVGRQLLTNYGFLSDHDIRMTPYTYEAAIFENRDFENITLRMAAVSGVKSLASTDYIDFVNASKDLLREVTVDRNPIRGDYNPAYFDSDRNYIGPQENLYLASIVYKDRQINFGLWNHYVVDFINIFYAIGSYTFQSGGFSNSVGVEWVKQDDVGEHVAGTINTYAYDMMVKSSYDNFTLQYVFSRVKYDESSLDGGTIIDEWGGAMLYCGMMYNGADQGGTTGHNLSLEYDFASYDLTLLLSAGSFDLPNKITDIFADQDNHEYDIIIKYRPKWSKKLEFKVEAAYIDFDTNYDFKAYEDLHGFDMLHAYDDIVDLRFIVNYTF